VFGTKIKLLLAAVIGSVAFVAGGSGASAAITSVSVDRNAVIQSDGSVLVTGTLTCTAGDTAFVEVQVVQSKGQLLADALGETLAITCTGSPQDWSIDTSIFAFGTFKPGQATSQTTAFDTTDDTGFAPVNQTLHLMNK
jgi:hypothetical protein